MNRISYHKCRVALLSGLLASVAHANEALTLPTALQRVLSQNPSLTAASELHLAAKGRADQASLLPNPEFSTQFEDFGGNTSASIGQATMTLGVSERLELSGKRADRVAIADANSNVTDTDILARRQDLVRDTRIAYITLQAARERLTLARQTQTLAQQVRDAVNARVAAGKVSPIEEARADIALSTAKRRIAQAERDQALARGRMAALWGGSSESPDPSEALSLPPAPDVPVGDGSGNPDLHRVARVVERARAEVQLSDAGRIPDVTVMVGTKRDATSHDHSLIVGASLPLPLFDRNQGERRAARADLAAAEANLKSERLQLTTELSNERQQLVSAYAEALQLQKGALNVTEQVFADAQEGYRVGKLSLLDVLDAQRAVIDTRNAYLDALVVYHENCARLDRLLGRDITVTEVAP